MPSAGETTRALRDRPLGKALILVAVLLAAVLVSRSCGRTEAKVSQEQAIAIAKKQVPFVPNHVLIRLMKRGFKSQPFWAVSLSQQQPDGSLENVTVVVLSATTGEIDEIRKSGP